MAQKMLIDATHLEETRVVVADGNKVNEFDFESINKRQLAGNIYLAKVTRVEPSLQAAFVDYGGNRHGFLAFSEIHPDYYQIPVADREALLAEEAAEHERSADREEEGEEKTNTRPRRGKRRTRGKQDETSTGSGQVKGLEVIELSEENSGTEDTAVPAGTAAPEVKGLEIADLTDGDAEGGKGEVAAGVKADSEKTAPIETAPAETAPAETAPAETAPEEPTTADAAPEETDEPGTPPKSIAESAGLDDEDTVSEDIAKAPTTDSPTADATPADGTPAASQVEEEAKPKPKARRTRKKASPKPAAETPAGEAPAAEAPAAEAPVAPAWKAEAPVAEPKTETETTETTEVATAESSPAGDDAAGQPAEEEAEAKKPTRARKRRTRSKDGAKEGAKEADDGNVTSAETDDPAESVESIGAEDTHEEAAQARARRRRHYKIQDVVKVRQIMLVQVVKEERGNKGAALTTYLSLAGRYCVLMPNTARGGGISRKITSAGDRKRLRDITNELDVPNGIGLIVRTAGAERTRAEIKRDYEFLIRQWEQIRELTLKSIAPSLIYEEGSLIKRSIRDLYSNEIDAILVEGEEGYREAKDYMKMLMPSHAKNVQRYDEQIPLFIRYPCSTRPCSFAPAVTSSSALPRHWSRLT
jgi:ribonuclease E